MKDIKLIKTILSILAAYGTLLFRLLQNSRVLFKNLSVTQLWKTNHLKTQSSPTCSYSPDGCCMMKKEAGKCDCDNLKDFIEELNS